VSLSTRHRALAGAQLLAALATLAAPAAQAQERDTATVFTPATYAVADFYRSTRFAGASWSPDRRRILVSSNQTGIWNAYAVPVTGGTPQPLTASTTNSIFSNSYFPRDERILYASDQGGNELTHLYVRNPDGSTKDLTPGEKLKAQFLGWSGDGRTFFVSSNERDQRYFDVYGVATDGYARTLLFRNDSGYSIGAISRDGRYLAVGKARTTSDADIHLVDRRSGTTRNITAHTGKVNNASADFSPDGRTLLFVSDAGREFASLRSYDIASGRTTPVFEQAWDVLGAEYSRGGRYLVVYVNDDSRSAARVLDARSFAPVALNGMPEGLVRGLSISPDDSAFAFYATDGSVPDELYVSSFAGAPTRLTNALDARIQRRDLVVPTIARFKSYDGVTIPGVLYRPHQASSSAKAPAVVLVHGGPGGQAQVGYFALTQALVNHGYVVFDINNRGSSGYGKTFFALDDRRHGEADLGDVVASKRMLVETGYVDSARIGIIGGSYGGYMTLAALTLQPDAFKTGVDLFGISNWVRTLTNIPPWWASFREALFAEMGDPGTDSVRLHRISPLFHAGRIKAPLMVLQGANDPRVLKVESDEIVAAARKNGVPVEYMVFPDEGHGFVKKENEIAGYSRVITFLDTYLKRSTAATSAVP
jgi:dipeptidyl aminopeptidase/acylaminoacyl peptidase